MKILFYLACVLSLATAANAATFTHLHFTGLPQTVSLESCAKLTVVTTDDAGNIAPDPADTFVAIGGAMGFDHFSDASCKTKSGGFTIPSGGSSGMFYISTVPCPEGIRCSLPIGASSITVNSGTMKAVQIITVQ